jgi:predicted nucleotidyltransferase
MKDLEEIKKKLAALNKEIKEQYKAEVIALFGSYVRHEQKKKSDLDILVKFYEGTTLFELVGLAIFLEEKLGIKKVDVVPYDAVREEIRDRILKEAVYL